MTSASLPARTCDAVLRARLDALRPMRFQCLTWRTRMQMMSLCTDHVVLRSCKWGCLPPRMRRLLHAFLSWEVWQAAPHSLVAPAH